MKQNEDKNIGILKGKCLALVPQMKVLKDSDWNKGYYSTYKITLCIFFH